MLRRIHDPEHGAGYIEYAAIILLVASIVAAVGTVGIPGRTTALINEAFRQIGTTQAEGGNQDPDRASDPTAEQIPDPGTGTDPTDTGPETPSNDTGDDTGGGSGTEGSDSKSDQDGEGDGGPLFELPDIDVFDLGPMTPTQADPLGLGDGGGVTTAFHPGGGHLQSIGLGELVDHDFYLDLPDFKLTDLAPGGPFLPRPEPPEEGEAEGLVDQLLSFDDEGGQIVTETLEGMGNAALHPVETLGEMGRSAKGAAEEYVAGALEARKQALQTWRDGHRLRSIGQLMKYAYWDSPINRSRLLVNQEAREHFANGDYGRGAAQVAGGLLEMIPALRATKLARGPNAPDAPAPPKTDPEAHHLADGNKPDKGTDGNKKPDKDPCARNRSLLHTPVRHGRRHHHHHRGDRRR